MKTLQKLAGISSISEAVIYLSAFIYFGAFWSYPSAGKAAEKMAYLADNFLVVSSIYFLIYVVFGVLLAVIVVALYETLKHTNNPAVVIGTLFGAVWVGLVIASGMISTVGLSHALELMDANPEAAFEMWSTFAVISESLGGGNELVGGLWVLLISLAALQAQEFSSKLNYLGLFIGAAGLATVYPADVFTEIFGVTQIVWFIWLGTELLRKENSSKPVMSSANESAG